MSRPFYLIAIIVLWAVAGFGVEPNASTYSDIAETVWEDTAPQGAASELEPNLSEEVEWCDKEAEEIEGKGFEEKEEVGFEIQHRLMRIEKRISDLEKILGPLQSNIKIFFQLWGLGLTAAGIFITVVLALGTKAGVAWIKKIFEEKTKDLSEDAQKKIDVAISRIDEGRTRFKSEAGEIMDKFNGDTKNALALMDNKVKSFEEEAEGRLNKIVSVRTENLSVFVRQLIDWTLEWFAKGDRDMLRVRDVFDALMLTESNEPRNVRNGCVVLQEFYRRGHPATELAPPRLYVILRRWIEIAEKAKTEEERKEAQRAVAELEETVKVLSRRSDTGGTSSGKEGNSGAG